MKKIAILINSMNGGGAERVVSILLEKLVKKYEIHLVLLNSGIAYQIPKQVKVTNLIQKNLHNNYLKIFALPLLAYRYYKYCQQNKINISFSLLNRANYINIGSKLMGAKYRTIISERAATRQAYPLHSLKGIISRMMVRLLYPKADAVIAISKGVAFDLVKFFRVDETIVHTIYNPINAAHYASEIDSGIKKNFTFITMARFDPQKNLPLLLEAFSQLKNEPVKLILLGEGPLKAQLTDMVHTLKIEDRVEMPGFVNNIHTYLNNADCFVLSSDYEGFGNVIIEALAAGKAVIATDCPHGPSEILADKLTFLQQNHPTPEFEKYGILVPKNNAAVLARAMKEMMLNENKRKEYETLGPARAREFNLEQIYAQYEKVLDN